MCYCARCNGNHNWPSSLQAVTSANWRVSAAVAWNFVCRTAIGLGYRTKPAHTYRQSVLPQCSLCEHPGRRTWYSWELCARLCAYNVSQKVAHQLMATTLTKHNRFLPERDYVTFGSLLSQFRLSVRNVGTPYSGGWSFRQYFFTAVYAGHPLTSVQNFTEVVPGEPLRRER